jgi:cytochrome c-type biogenesis protein CcmH
MDRTVLLVAAAAGLSVVGATAIGAWLTPMPPPAARSGPATAAPAPATPTADEIGNRIRGLEQRLEQSPDDLAGWKMLGRSYVAQGRYMEAVGAYSRAAQIDPRDAEVAGALKQLETIARDRGRHDETMKTR